MANRSIYTEAALELAAEHLQMRRESQKRAKDAIPFGQEKVSKAKLQRMLADNPTLRKTMLENPATRERVIDMYRRKGANNAV